MGMQQSPTPPFKNFLYSNQGGGALALVPLGAARICQRGVKARERSDQAGGACGAPPTVGNVFKISCMKTKFPCTLIAIIRG